MSHFRQRATAARVRSSAYSGFAHGATCAKLVRPGRLPLASERGRLSPARRLARGGPGALASPALGRRHEPAESVVVVQQVEFRAEAALRIPGEPLVRERLELKRRGLAAAVAGRALGAKTALAQVPCLRSDGGGRLVTAGCPRFRCLAGLPTGLAPGLLPLGPPGCVGAAGVRARSARASSRAS